MRGAGKGVRVTSKATEPRSCFVKGQNTKRNLKKPKVDTTSSIGCGLETGASFFFFCLEMRFSLTGEIRCVKVIDLDSSSELGEAGATSLL